MCVPKGDIADQGGVQSEECEWHRARTLATQLAVGVPLAVA